LRRTEKKTKDFPRPVTLLLQKRGGKKTLDAGGGGGL